MQNTIAQPQQLTSREVLANKALIHRKVSDKYQLRTDAILDAVNRLRFMAEQRGMEFYSSDIKPVSRRAAKSTRYTIQCRIGTGDVVPTITFRDSMNGESCTFIDFGMYRKVCSNGLHVATGNEQIMFKQNHLNQWKLDDATIVMIFDKAIEMTATTLNRYTSIPIPATEHPVTMRNRLIKSLAENGIITESQASTAMKYGMRRYDVTGDLFGIVNAVQESLTTNRNGQKKQTDANAQLNRRLLPAIDNALNTLYGIAA